MTEVSRPDPQEVPREEFLARRNRLEDLLSESRRTADKLLVSGAGGALVLSITFVNVIAPHPLPDTRSLLLAAWLEFGAALVLSFLSHLTSEASLRLGIDQEADAYEGRSAPPVRSWRRALRWILGSRGMDRATQLLNFGAPLLLLLGLLSMGKFALANTRFEAQPAGRATADSTAVRLDRIERLLDSLVRAPTAGVRFPPPPPPVRH